MIRIALDAMGGDYAPEEIIKGATLAAREFPVFVILVGDEEKISRELKKYCFPSSRIDIQHASEVIGNDESPAKSVKQKPNSSINVAVSLVKDKKADAVISAGNTGALMAASLFGLGRIKGIERPAIATVFPLQKDGVLLLDMGANVDCKPKHLQQFALMGSLYAERVMHIKNPRVGLLNIGEEPEKGNELTQTSYPLLASSNIKFIGNVESKEIMDGKVDVIICDGFIGNLILKFAESLSYYFMGRLKKEIKKSPLSMAGALMMMPAFSSLKKTIDYDEYGAAPLLGIDGVCFKAHGRAKSKAILNAVRVTAEAVREKLVECISMAEEKL